MKKTAAMFLSVALLLGFAACADEQKTSKVVDVSGEIVQTEQYEIWGAYSTEKILKEETDYENKKNAQISLNAVKNEYESAQLVITAAEDVSEYYLQAAELTDGAGHTIAAENVEIYNEWYTYVDIPTNTLSEQGSYPDGLVPIDLARDAGELQIEAGSNQGIWVTVYVPAETAAGTYTARFPLTVENTVYNIPVTVKVYDYELPVEGENDALYVSRTSTLMASELNSTLEMKEKYYEFFLDYRINLNVLPIETLDVDEFAAVAKRYAVDDRVNLICLAANTDGQPRLNFPLWREQIMRLAEESTAEINYLDKACAYFIDEPEGTGEVPQAIAYLNTWNSMLADIVDEIEADDSGKYDGFKANDNWQSSVTDIRCVVTCNPESTQISDLCNVWCPGYGNFFTQAAREWKVQRAEEKGAELWWYGCNGPLAPYPTLHIDDKLASGRLVSWLQQAYQVHGQLYWSVTTGSNAYEDYWFSYESNQVQSVIANGDGYLVYPGAKYGYEGPLPSMRLMAVRDGYEEYELLMDIEHRYDELAEDYGVTFDSRSAVAEIYSRLYTNMVCTTDSALIEEVRLDLLNTLVEAFQPHGFLLTDIEISETTADLTMYVQDGCTIAHNGTPLQGEGNRYTYALDLTENSYFEAVITDAEGGEYRVSRFVGVPQYTLMNFDDASCVKAATGSKGAQFALNADPAYAVSGSSLGITAPSVFTGDEFTDRFYEPYADIASSAFAEPVTFDQIDMLYFTLFNPSASEVTVTVSLLGEGTTVVEVEVVRIAANGRTQAALDIANLGWANKASCRGIRLSFANAQDSSGAPVVYTIYIDNMTYELIA